MMLKKKIDARKCIIPEMKREKNYYIILFTK